MSSSARRRPRLPVALVAAQDAGSAGRGTATETAAATGAAPWRLRPTATVVSRGGAAARAACASVSPAATPRDERPPPPTLADVATLTRESDYSRFVAPEVDGEVKNAALKKLFGDPRFNVMDGLDVYIDDYSKPDPLPASMLRQMAQAAFLGLIPSRQRLALQKQSLQASPQRTPPRLRSRSLPRSTAAARVALRPLNPMKTLICDCNHTMPLDAAALKTALQQTAPASSDGLEHLHTLLCRREAGAFQRAAKATGESGEELLVACTQERRLFLELNEQTEGAASLDVRPIRFVNIRETGGWSRDAKNATPKIAALIAAAQGPAPQPVANVSYRSGGRCLIIGAADAAERRPRC